MDPQESAGWADEIKEAVPQKEIPFKAEIEKEKEAVGKQSSNNYQTEEAKEIITSSEDESDDGDDSGTSSSSEEQE